MTIALSNWEVKAVNCSYQMFMVEMYVAFVTRYGLQDSTQLVVTGVSLNAAVQFLQRLCRCLRAGFGKNVPVLIPVTVY